MPSDAEDGALRDILHHIDLVQQFTGANDFDSFRDDTMRVYAVTRCLEIISEASRRVSDSLKARHPDIAWKQMAGAGNIYRSPGKRNLDRVEQSAAAHPPPHRSGALSQLERE